MRQVYKLLRVIERQTLVSQYTDILSYRLAFHAKELPSLEEFLGISSNSEVKVFDEKTDKFLEEKALKRLEERRKNV